MEKITDYDIISAEKVRELVSTVRRAIRDGWEPHGGLIFDTNSDCFCQVVVRKLKIPEYWPSSEPYVGPLRTCGPYTPPNWHPNIPSGPDFPTYPTITCGGATGKSTPAEGAAIMGSTALSVQMDPPAEPTTVRTEPQ